MRYKGISLWGLTVGGDGDGDGVNYNNDVDLDRRRRVNWNIDRRGQAVGGRRGKALSMNLQVLPAVPVSHPPGARKRIDRSGNLRRAWSVSLA